MGPITATAAHLTASPLNTEGLRSLGGDILGLVIVFLAVIVGFAIKNGALSKVLFVIAGVCAIALLVSLSREGRMDAVGDQLFSLFFGGAGGAQ